MRWGLFCLMIWTSGSLVGLRAQDQATIVGTARDTSGAVIPGVKVTVANPDKGFTRVTATNSAGEYSVAKVPIGNYVVTAQVSGFQKLLRTGITLTVGQTLRVDLQLTLGQVTQEVTVAGNTAKVETENATVSNVVTGSQILNLNLNGRNYQALLALTPGVAENNGINLTVMGHNAVARFSVNGTRIQNNDFEIDGAGSTDDSGGGDSPEVLPNLDSIAEFRVLTSDYGADVGKRSGAITEVVTKSGTKDFHGTLYEFVRNDAMDANPWFVNRRLWSGLNVQANCGGNPAGPCNAPKTPLKHNDFGYNFGGPFYIPGHYNTSKTKTFFFWSENWARYRQGSVLSANVPSLLMRQGNFSECDRTSGNYNPIVASGCTVPTNPATGQPFSGDVVPINSNAQTLLNSLVPLPNNGPIGYTVAPSLPTNYRQESIRVDQNINEKNTVFVRYTQDTWNQIQLPTYGTSYTYDSVVTNFRVPAKNIVTHFNHIFKPNLMNEVVLSFGNDPHSATDLPGPGSSSGSIAKPSSWTGGTLIAANANDTFLPDISVSGGTPFSFSEGPHFGVWGTRPVQTGTFKDNVVYTVGRHTLKMGMYILDTRINTTGSPVPPAGQYSFTTGTPTTSHNGLADMFLGQITQYTEGSYVANGTPAGGWGEVKDRRMSYEPYFQDDWKLNPHLTLNLGVRYYYTPEHDVTMPSSDSNFYPALYNPAQQAQLDSNGNVILSSGYNFTKYGNGLLACGVSGVPLACRNMPKNNWAPRFGFAYDPTGSGRTVIRGGYGIYYDMNTGEGFAQQGGNPPSFYVLNAFNIAGYQNIVPGPLAPDSAGANTPIGPWTSIQQFNVTVEHEFPGNNLLSVGWVGTIGNHLSRAHNINNIPDGVGMMNVPALAGTAGCDASGNCDVQNILINHQHSTNFFRPYQAYGPIDLSELAASSRYESLQVNYRHAVGHGLSFQAVYTYAHGIDNASSDSNPPLDSSNLNRWYATQSFNRTHVFVANYVYDMPFFQNATNRFLKNGLGGWELSGITSFFSGQPVDFSCGVSGKSSGIGEGMRCNTLGPLKIDKSTFNDPRYGPTPTWFDPSMIAQPNQSQYYANNQPGMFGYMGRDVLTGPGRNNWDLALLKNVRLPWLGSEPATLQFRLETFNTFNHPQWQGIQAGCGGNTPYGAPCSGIQNNLGNGEVTSAWDPRNVQLGLKFMF